MAKEESLSRSEVIAKLLKKEEKARIEALMAEGYREMAEENGRRESPGHRCHGKENSQKQTDFMGFAKFVRLFHHYIVTFCLDEAGRRN